MCLAYCYRASNRIINGWDSLLTTNSHVVDHDRIVVRIVRLNVFKTNQEAVDVDVLPRYRDYKDTTIKKKIKKEKDTEISLQRILHSAGHAAIFFFFFFFHQFFIGFQALSPKQAKKTGGILDGKELFICDTSGGRKE